MWTGPESNRRHTAFQAVALPTELPVLMLLLKILRTYYEIESRQVGTFQAVALPTELPVLINNLTTFSRGLGIALPTELPVPDNF